MNKEHWNNFEAVYNELINLSMGQNRKLEADRGYKLRNYHNLYSSETFALTDGRNITIRKVRIPVFGHQNKPRYHTIFLCSTVWWEAGSIPSIAELCRSKIRWKDNDRYTIFLTGLQKGLVHKGHSWIFRKNNTFVINSRRRHVDEVRSLIFKTLSSFYREKCIGLYKKIKKIRYKKVVWNKERLFTVHMYGQLKKDWMRLNELSRSLYMIARYWWKIKAKRIGKLKKEQVKKESLTISNNCSINAIKEEKRMLQIPNINYRKATILKPV